MVKSKWKAIKEAFKEAFKKSFNETKELTKNRLKAFSLFMICFFIALAFIRLFLLLKENNYSEIITYGEKVTVLIGALAGLTFAYAATFEKPDTERIAVRKIGESFLKSFLYFVIGLMFSIGFRDAMSKPSGLSIFPDILASLSLILMFILFFSGFGMLIISAYYLGDGIYDLTKSLSK